MKAMVHLSDDDINFFDIVTGVLEGDTLVPYIFIICLDYIRQMSIDLMKEMCFTLKKQEADNIPQKV